MLVFALSFNTACGQVQDGEFERSVDCIDGCTSVQEAAPDSSTTTITVVGAPGRDGKSVQGPKGDTVVGPQGDPGNSCSVEDTDFGANVTCGLNTVSIFDGLDGVGIAGQSCSVTPTPTGAMLTCGLDSVAINHGLDGQDGADAPFAISEVVDPCGDGPGPDEVILVFATGEWIAWYVDLGLSILTPGATYQTSDQQACIFSVPL